MESLPDPEGLRENVLDCNYNLDWPHNSGHVAGEVTSNGVITFRSNKKYLGVETELYYSKLPWWTQVDHKKDKHDDAKYVAAAAHRGCLDGRYKATGYFLMLEYNGTRHPSEHHTAEVDVRCNCLDVCHPVISDVPAGQEWITDEPIAEARKREGIVSDISEYR